VLLSGHGASVRAAGEQEAAVVAQDAEPALAGDGALFQVRQRGLRVSGGPLCVQGVGAASVQRVERLIVLVCLRKERQHYGGKDDRDQQ
jgi:hypothetical protein